ncbi:MAG: DUF4835 family protein [Hyphomicrobiales bacterium]
MRRILSAFIFLMIFSSPVVVAQEFYCNVSVNSQKVQESDKKIYEAMQKAIYEFMNNRKWTNYNFKPDERLECNILLTIEKRPSVDEFEGSLTLALRRPVYKSAYNSVLFNYKDTDLHFRFSEFEPLQFYDNNYTNNLSSTLAFYAYIFLGLDFDTFQLYGGTQFYKKAEQVVNAAQNSNEKGWKSFDDSRNRYWLVENLLNSQYKPLRKFLYDYHRTGLDVMSEDVTGGRANITKSIPLLEEVYNERPGLFLLSIILDAKRDEIINIYSEGSPQEKNKVVNIMKEIDAANGSKYSDILKNK